MCKLGTGSKKSMTFVILNDDFKSLILCSRGMFGCLLTFYASSVQNVVCLCEGDGLVVH